MNFVYFLLLLLLSSTVSAVIEPSSENFFQEKPTDVIANYQKNNEPYVYCVIHVLPYIVDTKEAIDYLNSLPNMKEEEIDKETVSKLSEGKEDKRAEEFQEHLNKSKKKPKEVVVGSNEEDGKEGDKEKVPNTKNIIMRLRRLLVEDNKQNEITNSETDPVDQVSDPEVKKVKNVDSGDLTDTEERAAIRWEFSFLFVKTEGRVVVADCMHNNTSSTERFINGGHCGSDHKKYKVKQIYDPSFLKYNNVANFSGSYPINTVKNRDINYFVNKAGRMPMELDFYDNECSLDLISNSVMLGRVISTLFGVWILI